MNQQSGFGAMMTDMLNYAPFGMAYGAIAGHPMIGGNQGMQNRGPQNPNQLGAPSFASVPQEGNWWSGNKPQVMTSSPFTGNQQNLMNMLGMMGMQGLQTGQMPGGMSFDPIQKQAETQFNTQTIPSLAERFTSMGGGQRSSAFQGALGQAGAGLQENLAAMKSQYAMQMMPMLMQMMNMGLRPQYEQQYMPGSPSFMTSLAGGVGQALPYAAKAAML